MFKILTIMNWLQVFPVVYCLMTNKTTQAYEDVFKFVNERLFPMQPSISMTDYEHALRNAIKNIWPNCEIRGCEFHFKQAINRKCKTFPDLRILLKNSFFARKTKKMLMNIAQLPASQIMQGLEAVRIYANKWKLSTQFAELFSYFERQWLREVRFFRTFCKLNFSFLSFLN